MTTSYSKEFKVYFVAYVTAHPTLTISKCAENLGINPNTLHT